jgi:hypothetical protein
MSLEQLISLVLEKGMGLGSFIVLVLGLWKGSSFATTFITNHWVHFTETMYGKLDLILSKLDEISKKQ